MVWNVNLSLIIQMHAELMGMIEAGVNPANFYVKQKCCSINTELFVVAWRHSDEARLGKGPAGVCTVILYRAISKASWSLLRPASKNIFQISLEKPSPLGKTVKLLSYRIDEIRKQ